MATAKPQEYGNESISQLKGADRVRKRPGVIFGSDGLDTIKGYSVALISELICSACPARLTVFSRKLSE